MSDAVTRQDTAPLPDYVPVTAAGQATGQAKRRRRVVVAVVTCFVLLASACVFSGIMAWQDFKATGAVVDAREARRAGTLILVALLNAETGQRGFLLMRNPDYLAPYYAAKSEFETALSELRTRLPGSAPRTAQADSIARIGGEKFGEMDKTIALAKSGRFDDALALVRSGTGRSLMIELRQTVDELTAEGNDDIARATALERETAMLLAGAIVAALVCVAGLAGLLLYDARRHYGVLEGRETSARQLAEILERRVVLRTRELAEANQRFAAALRASGVTVMTQDRDLVFTWISGGVHGRTAQEVIGKSQREITPEASFEPINNLKRGVIETGEPAHGDVRITRGGSEFWYELTAHPLTDEFGIVTGVIAGAIDITRHKEQEARIRLLMRELTHRSKNLLSVIQAIMRQTAINSDSLADFETRFSARLQSLAGSHDLLVEEDWQGASMRELARSQLGHYIDRVGSQIELSGEPLQIPPDAAQHIGMAMHELATNASKYGALSVPTGKVRISWRVDPGPDGERTCHLSWEESGGPPVEPPSRRGFGRVVIERTVARAVLGEVNIEYAPSGLKWSLVFPERPAAKR
jgi:PAS domain S-box-containing protein